MRGKHEKLPLFFSLTPTHASLLSHPPRTHPPTPTHTHPMPPRRAAVRGRGGAARGDAPSAAGRGRGRAPRGAPPAAPPATPAAARAAAATAAVQAWREQEAAAAALARQRDAAQAVLDALEAQTTEAETRAAAANAAARRAIARAGGGAALAPTTHITALPQDVVLEAAALLDPRSRLAMAATCATWRASLTAQPQALAWADVDVDRSDLFGDKGAIKSAATAIAAHAGDVRALHVSRLNLRREHKWCADLIPSLTRLTSLRVSLPFTFNREGPATLFTALGARARAGAPTLVALTIDHAPSRRGRGRHAGGRHAWAWDEGPGWVDFRTNELSVTTIGNLGPRTLSRLTHLGVVDVAPSALIALARLLMSTRGLRSLAFSRAPPALDAGELPQLTSLLANDLRANLPAEDRLRWLATVTDASLGKTGGYSGINALLRHLPRLTSARIFLQQWTRRMVLPDGLAHATALRDVTVVRESWGYLEPTQMSLSQLTGLSSLTSLRVEKMGHTQALETPAPLAALRNLVLTLIATDFTFPSSLPVLTRLVLASSAAPSSPLKLSVAPLATTTAPALELLKVSGFQLVALSTNAADACGDADAVAAMAAYTAASNAHAGALHALPPPWWSAKTRCKRASWPRVACRK